MASTYELQEVLHPRVITDLYREEAGKYQTHPLVEFYSKGIKDIRGDRFEFAYRAAMKKPAPANMRGQPARVQQPTGLRNDRVYMLHAFNEVGLSMDALQMIRRPNDETLQEKGREEIAMQMEDFGDRHNIFRAVCLAKTLFDSTVYFDANGNVLEDSTGNAYSVDFGVPSSHRSQITAASDSFSGAIIDAAWDTAGAKIFDHLDNVQMAAEEINADVPTHIWAPTEAKKWLRNNTQVLGFLQASPEQADRILAGTMIEDLNGWTWHFNNNTYTGSAGTAKRYIPATKVLMTPEPGEWLAAANGSELITSVEGIAAGVEAALANITEVFGDFSYVKLVDNPTKLVLRMGTNFVYAFKNPNCVWAPTVDF